MAFRLQPPERHASQPTFVARPPGLRPSHGGAAAPLVAGRSRDPSLISASAAATRPRRISSTLKILAALTVLSLAPAILMLMTSFTRIVIVLSFVRQSLGVQAMPPNQVLVGLALLLSLLRDGAGRQAGPRAGALALPAGEDPRGEGAGSRDRADPRLHAPAHPGQGPRAAARDDRHPAAAERAGRPAPRPGPGLRPLRAAPRRSTWGS